jgi:hypothetical protein
MACPKRGWFLDLKHRHRNLIARSVRHQAFVGGIVVRDKYNRGITFGWYMAEKCFEGVNASVRGSYSDNGYTHQATPYDE